MIPELKTPAPRNRQQYASAFQRGPSERPLRLLLDWDTIPSGPMADVLDELCENPQIEAYGTHSTDARRVEFISGGDFTQPCAAQVSHNGELWQVSLLEDDRHRYAHPAGAVGPSNRWMRESQLAVFSLRGSMDALVTGSADLLRRSRSLVLEGEPNVVSPDGAAALAGLFLRSRGEYSRTTRKPGVIDWRSGEDFYRALAITLLPSSRLWLGATLPRNAREMYDDTFAVHAALTQSVISQVARALRARDHVQIQRRGELSSDTALEITSQFEYALICLHGAFDTLAHLCAVAYKLSRKRMDSWQHEGWLKKLSSAPETQVVASVANSDEVQRTLELLGELRNTVHGPALQPRIGTTSRDRRVVLLVPPTRLSSFQAALSRWSGAPETWWGARYHHRGPMEFHEDLGSHLVSYPSGPEYPVADIEIDPGICLERLFVFALEALDRLAASIDWSQLGGPGFLPLRAIPVGDDGVQERLRLLGGVSL